MNRKPFVHLSLTAAFLAATASLLSSSHLYAMNEEDKKTSSSLPKQNDVQDEKEDFKSLKTRADQGDIHAQRYVALMYLHAEGVEKNDQEAFKYFKLTADQGSLDGQYAVAHMYENGEGIEKDATKAFRYYRLAANGGDKYAQAKVSLMYENGQGVEKNEKKAVKYLKLAADGGVQYAQAKIAMMYENGQGLEKDATKAFHYYKLAADRGFQDAQYQVSRMYDKGIGVEKNEKKAVKYLKLAGMTGFSKIGAVPLTPTPTTPHQQMTLSDTLGWGGPREDERPQAGERGPNMANPMKKTVGDFIRDVSELIEKRDGRAPGPLLSFHAKDEPPQTSERASDVRKDTVKGLVGQEKICEKEEVSNFRRTMRTGNFESAYKQLCTLIDKAKDPSEGIEIVEAFQPAFNELFSKSPKAAEFFIQKFNWPVEHVCEPLNRRLPYTLTRLLLKALEANVKAALPLSQEAWSRISKKCFDLHKMNVGNKKNKKILYIESDYMALYCSIMAAKSDRCKASEKHVITLIKENPAAIPTLFLCFLTIPTLMKDQGAQELHVRVAQAIPEIFDHLQEAIKVFQKEKTLTSEHQEALKYCENTITKIGENAWQGSLDSRKGLSDRLDSLERAIDCGHEQAKKKRKELRESKDYKNGPNKKGKNTTLGHELRERTAKQCWKFFKDNFLDKPVEEQRKLTVEKLTDCNVVLEGAVDLGSPEALRYSAVLKKRAQALDVRETINVLSLNDPKDYLAIIHSGNHLTHNTEPAKKSSETQGQNQARKPMSPGLPVEGTAPSEADEMYQLFASLFLNKTPDQQKALSYGDFRLSAAVLWKAAALGQPLAVQCVEQLRQRPVYKNKAWEDNHTYADPWDALAERYCVEECCAILSNPKTQEKNTPATHPSGQKKEATAKAAAQPTKEAPKETVFPPPAPAQESEKSKGKKEQVTPSPEQEEENPYLEGPRRAAERDAQKAGSSLPLTGNPSGKKAPENAPAPKDQETTKKRDKKTDSEDAQDKKKPSKTLPLGRALQKGIEGVQKGIEGLKQGVEGLKQGAGERALHSYLHRKTFSAGLGSTSHKSLGGGQKPLVNALHPEDQKTQSLLRKSQERVARDQYQKLQEKPLLKGRRKTDLAGDP
jgi:hypothetical protein